ncbi:MAG: hypothetical protein UU73_C0003G0190 [Candidatus Daviesbacteria bacterium GW2011_GWA1_41_61]|uniref:Type II secretion system protein G n=1 Tax=Candidatus Daviesbacteria bacterium GW2011_GWA2_40_9 TaxID=1618424 RepID=A0A0G0U993_9BACT|nr:MAG: general secretion pathway protein G, general secretion pathway protein G [Candidatus Daviesbacteria bacterium GW2011_GWC1_40_9]KKR83851.1 MAG: hypothetical protein UU29_C0001G0071 [Candidatus Daviesbacteria bacterium GW2011_GWA2_40_9]KKR93460.1 MAG: hypothetical protein UU44_C0002G0121 [Candidatus Daviesbacteria bacterium GW2011_GWB1_41_15]KKS14991.1 MAG: hypothetical protein UU73_C0003G0190 [Candidatus Daviesbacteria bacterium GW2011_GWA1_41_61]
MLDLMPYSRGFTILELLVVISIMILLSVLGLSVYGNAQKNNRDQARLLDLNTISQYLELYRHDQLYYPQNFNPSIDNQLQAPDGRVYSDDIPKDVDANRKYVYSAADCVTVGGQTKCYSYILCAKQEGGMTFTDPLVGSVKCSDLTCGSSPAYTCTMGVSSD